MNPRYVDIARTLVRVAPLVLADDRFALKGGTAINFFLRDLPRLSVDLDLVLADGTLDRAAALAAIGEGLARAHARLEAAGFAVRSRTTQDEETTLFARQSDTEVKIEVNHVMRGTVHPVRRQPLTARAQEILRAEVTLPVLAADEVYGSKLVAACDRQHPRDMYDVAQLFAHGGITPGIRRCFVVYLACHNRPVHEVLFAPERPLDDAYRNQFAGMTAEDVPLAALAAARARLLRELPAALDAAERRFLRTLVRGEPDCEALGLPHVAALPAVRWKVANLQRLREHDRRRFEQQAEALGAKLGAAA